MFPSIISLEDRYKDKYANADADDECIWIYQEVKESEILLSNLLNTQELNHIILAYTVDSYQKVIIDCINKLDPTPFFQIPLLPLHKDSNAYTNSEFEESQRAQQQILLRAIAGTIENKKTFQEKKKFFDERDAQEKYFEDQRQLSNKMTKQAFSFIGEKFRILCDEYEAAARIWKIINRDIYAYLGRIINRYYNTQTKQDKENVTLATRGLTRDIYVALFETHTALQTIIKVDSLLTKGSQEFNFKRSPLREDEKWRYYLDRVDYEQHDAFTEDQDAPLETLFKLESKSYQQDVSYFNVEEIGTYEFLLLNNSICRVLCDGSLACYGSGWAWRLSREEIHDIYLQNLPSTRITHIQLDLNIDAPRIPVDEQHAFQKFHESLLSEQVQKVKQINEILEEKNMRLKELKKQWNEVERETYDIESSLKEAREVAENLERPSYVASNRYKRKATVLKEGEGEGEEVGGKGEKQTCDLELESEKGATRGTTKKARTS